MIHALLLSLFLAVPQEGPLHAGLHPADSDLYVELGDPTELLKALDGAPVVDLLRDERLKGLREELEVPAEANLTQLVKDGLGRVSPEWKIEDWFDGLGTLSLSLHTHAKAEGETSLGYLAVLDLDTPAQAAALREVMLASVPHEPIAGATEGLETVHFPDGDGWCLLAGSRLVVGDQATPVEGYLARKDGQASGYASGEAFQKQLGGLQKASGTPVGWFALRRSLEEMLAGMPDEQETIEVLRQVPADLNPVGSPRVARMQLVGKRFVTEIVSSEPAGASATPVDVGWLARAPAEAMMLFSTSLDGADAGRRMRELLAADESSAASLHAVEEKLGYGPERVLAHLGPGMCVVAMPLAGIGLPETRAWIDCDDPAAFASEFEALVTALGESLPGFQAKTKPYKVRKADADEKVEVPITTLSLPPGMIQIPMISVSPSFAPVDGKLLFALNSMDVKSELKRVYGEPPGPTLLAATKITVPADARSVLVMDWAKLFGGLIAMAKAMAPMIGPEQMPFDLNKLPPPELFSDHLKPTVFYAKSIDGGIYRRNEASFGPETWFGFLMAGFSARQTMTPDPMMGGEMEPGSDY